MSKYTRRMLRGVMAAAVILAPVFGTAAHAATLIIDEPIVVPRGETFNLEHDDDIEIRANITQQGNTGEINIYSFTNIRVAAGVSITAGEVLWISAGEELELELRAKLRARNRDGSVYLKAGDFSGELVLRGKNVIRAAHIDLETDRTAIRVGAKSELTGESIGLVGSGLVEVRDSKLTVEHQNSPWLLLQVYSDPDTGDPGVLNLTETKVRLSRGTEVDCAADVVIGTNLTCTP